MKHSYKIAFYPKWVSNMNDNSAAWMDFSCYFEFGWFAIQNEPRLRALCWHDAIDVSTWFGITQIISELVRYRKRVWVTFTAFSPWNQYWKPSYVIRINQYPFSMSMVFERLMIIATHILKVRSHVTFAFPSTLKFNMVSMVMQTQLQRILNTHSVCLYLHHIDIMGTFRLVFCIPGVSPCRISESELWF